MIDLQHRSYEFLQHWYHSRVALVTAALRRIPSTSLWTRFTDSTRPGLALSGQVQLLHQYAHLLLQLGDLASIQKKHRGCNLPNAADMRRVNIAYPMNHSHKGSPDRRTLTGRYARCPHARRPPRRRAAATRPDCAAGWRSARAARRPPCGPAPAAPWRPPAASPPCSSPSAAS